MKIERESLEKIYVWWATVLYCFHQSISLSLSLYKQDISTNVSTITLLFDMQFANFKCFSTSVADEVSSVYDTFGASLI